MLHPSSIFTTYLENLTNINNKECSLINLTICLTNIDNQINDFYIIDDLGICHFREKISHPKLALTSDAENVRHKPRERHFIAQD